MAENINAGTAIVKADVCNLAVDDPVLAKYAIEIRRLGKRVKEDIIAIGRYLEQAQEHAGHGAWLTWIEVEFGWSDQTAYRFIHLYRGRQNSESFPEFHKLWNSDLSVSALQQLAAPSTPKEARVEVAARVQAGEKVSCAVVTEVIAKAKGKSSATNAPGAEDNGDSSNSDFGDAAAEILIEARRAQMEALAADEHEHDNNNSLAVRAKRIRGLLREQKTLEQKLAIAIAGATEQELIAALDDEEQLLAAFDKTAPILEEYFAKAGGADIYDRIPVARLDEVIAAFLDKLTVEGMCTRMSEEFGRELRARVPAPKSGKPFKKGMNLPANSARNGRGHRSRH
jgi:hypothetical protein